METTMQVFLETMLRPRRDGQHLTRFDGGQITRQRTYPYIPTTLMGLMGLMGLTYAQRAKRGNAWSPHRVYALGIWTPLNPANPSKPLGRNGSALTGGGGFAGLQPQIQTGPRRGSRAGWSIRRCRPCRVRPAATPPTATGAAPRRSAGPSAASQGHDHPQ